VANSIWTISSNVCVVSFRPPKRWYMASRIAKAPFDNIMTLTGDDDDDDDDVNGEDGRSLSQTLSNAGIASVALVHSKRHLMGGLTTLFESSSSVIFVSISSTGRSQFIFRTLAVSSLSVVDVPHNVTGANH